MRCSVSGLIGLSRAGWHFTFLGGAERVREKISAYSHTESYVARLLAPGQAERSIETGYSVGGRRDLARYTEIDGTYPKAVTDNIDYYQKLGFIKTPAQRIAELERAFESLSEQSRRNADLLGQLAAPDRARGCAAEALFTSTLSGDQIRRTKFDSVFSGFFKGFFPWLSIRESGTKSRRAAISL